MNARNKKQSGFTLIELVIIMAIVGILGAVGAVKFYSMQADANKAAVSNALANVRSALAISIAKDKDGKISYADLTGQLDGKSVEGTSGKFTWGGSDGTAFTVETDSSDLTNITSIVSVSKDGVTAP